MTPTSPQSHTRRKQILLILIGLLALVGVAALLQAKPWRPAADPEIPLDIAPARADEFLIIVAPFRREGEQPRSIGGVLAQDLQQELPSRTRIEYLPRAPMAEIIPNIITAYQPRLIITGNYDDANIQAQIEFIPPSVPPPLPEEAANDLIALFPAPKPQHYQLYAPLGNEHPLRYLQYWIQAQSYFWQGDYPNALSALKDAKRLLPPSVPLADRDDMDRFSAVIAWQLAIIAGPVQGNWQAAFDLFSDALRLDPGDPTPALGQAAALAQLRNLTQAELTLRQSLRDHADDWRIYFALAQIEMQKGDAGVGLNHYETAINLLQAQPSTPELALASVYVSRGYQLLQMGEYAKAQADFQQALQLGRNDVYVQGNLGWAAYMAGDYEIAVRASAAARQLAPDRPDLAFNEALHLLAAGQPEAARVAYREAIDLTLRLDDVLTRSTYFGVAYRDLADLQQRMPDLSEIIQQIQDQIDQANG